LIMKIILKSKSNFFRLTLVVVGLLTLSLSVASCRTNKKQKYGGPPVDYKALNIVEKHLDNNFNS